MNNEYLEKLKHFYKENNYKVNGMKLKKWFESNPLIYTELNNIFNKNKYLTKITNLMWFLVHDIDYTKFKCKVCNKQLKIKHYNYIPIYCCVKCSYKDGELLKKRQETISKDKDYYKKRQEKIKKTCLEKYGTTTPSQNINVKNKMLETIKKDKDYWKKRNEKRIKTCLEKYGVNNPSSTKEVREKVKQTYLEKYGVDNPNKLSEIQEKIKKTCLEKYGVDCQFKRKDVIEQSLKKSWNNILSWKDIVIPLFTFEEYSRI